MLFIHLNLTIRWLSQHVIVEVIVIAITVKYLQKTDLDIKAKHSYERD